MKNVKLTLYPELLQKNHDAQVYYPKIDIVKKTCHQEQETIAQWPTQGFSKTVIERL